MKIINKAARAALLSTISIASFGIGSTAYAQDEAAPQAEDAADEDVIVVTATKREQTLQDVPVAVSVTTAAAIERAQVRDLKDLQTLVPSLRVSQLQSSASTDFIIRGFGNGSNNVGIEGSVGVFIDGVYRSRSASAISDLPNLQRVEVLRGPQSTLFGKNASAGVISIVTAAPRYEFGGSVEASYGNFDAIVLKGDVTGPIVADKIAFSLAGGINKRDGYGTNLVDGSKTSERDRWYARAQLLIEPSDSISFRIIGDYDKIDEDCCFVGSVLAGPTAAAIEAVGGRINRNGIFSYSEYQNFASQNDITNKGVSVQGDFELGALKVTSISAYRESRSITNADSDFTSADIIGINAGDIDIETKTQELRLTSDFDGPFNFLLGGYYFDENIRNRQELRTGRDFRNYVNALTGGAFIANEPLIRLLAGIPATAPAFGGAGQGRVENWSYKNKAYSVFGTVDFEITDGVTLTGGFNYTKDKKDVASNTIVDDVFSNVDLVAVAGAAGIPAVLPPGTLGPGQTNPVFPRITSCTTGAPAGTCNPFLGFRALQFQPQFLNFPNAVEDGRTRDGKWTYSARIAWEATDNLNFYASYGTGFKATSWNISFDSRPFGADFIPGSPAQGAPLGSSAIRTAGLALNNLTSGTRFALPEEATVMEAGLKARWDQVAFNLTVFKQSIKNFQGNSFVGTGFVLTNAGKQSTFGVEFDGSVSPVEGLRLTAGFTYLDPIFDSYPGSPDGDLTGRQPAGISELSATLGATYTHEFGDDNAVILSTDFYHQAQVLINNNPAFRLYQREVNDLNASATLRLGNGLQFTVWGRNLTGAKYLQTIFPSVVQAGSVSGYPSQPRTYGVAAKFKF
jgi:iron complex outermembrane recepter protein